MVAILTIVEPPKSGMFDLAGTMHLVAIIAGCTLTGSLPALGLTLAVASALGDRSWYIFTIAGAFNGIALHLLLASIIGQPAAEFQWRATAIFAMTGAVAGLIFWAVAIRDWRSREW